MGAPYRLKTLVKLVDAGARRVDVDLLNADVGRVAVLHPEQHVAVAVLDMSAPALS